MNRVLQAGHWKSLKTSITIGAFLEPTETCGSTSGTAVVNWAALMPSAGASSSAKRPAKLRASELAFRKRSTQSSSTFLYNPEILPVILDEMKLCQCRCAGWLHLFRY